MRQIAGLPLWLGHVGDARDLRAVLSAGILAVVDLAVNEPPLPMTGPEHVQAEAQVRDEEPFPVERRFPRSL